MYETELKSKCTESSGHLAVGQIGIIQSVSQSMLETSCVDSVLMILLKIVIIMRDSNLYHSIRQCILFHLHLSHLYLII